MRGAYRYVRVEEPGARVDDIIEVLGRGEVVGLIGGPRYVTALGVQVGVVGGRKRSHAERKITCE
jgi:hypothetical protein